MDAAARTHLSTNAHSAAPLIHWGPGLSVGIEEIDAQHRVLVDIVNQLHAAILAHHGSSEVVPVLNELVEYTRMHFAVEESLMRVLGYPEYEEHKARHEALLEQVFDFRRRVVGEGRLVTFELMHFLKQWLTLHIMESDHRYSGFFLQRGVQASYEKPSLLRRLWSRGS